MNAAKKTTTTKTTTKKAAPKKATPKGAKPPKEKAAKQPEPEKKKGPKPNRVFAIRVTDDELAAIHKAAGPRNATRFIRQVAAAFANTDEAAFRTVLKDAREARQ